MTTSLPSRSPRRGRSPDPHRPIWSLLRGRRSLVVVASVVAVLLAGLSVGGASAQSGATVAERGLALGVESLMPAPEGSDFQPASDPAVPDDGMPIDILRTSVVGIELGRPVEADDFAVGTGTGVEQVNPGSVDFAVGRTSLTIYMVEYDRSIADGGNVLDGATLAFTHPGEVPLTQSSFANDPLLGYSNVLDRASVGGQAFSSYQRVVEGSWQPYTDPIAAYSFATASGWVLSWIVPGVPADAAALSGHAATQVPEALYVAKVPMASPTDLVPVDALPATDALLAAIGEASGTDESTEDEDGSDDEAVETATASEGDDASASDSPDETDASTDGDDGGGLSPVVVAGVGIALLIVAGGGVALAKSTRGRGVTSGVDAGDSTDPARADVEEVG